MARFMSTRIALQDAEGALPDEKYETFESCQEGAGPSSMLPILL